PLIALTAAVVLAAAPTQAQTPDPSQAEPGRADKKAADPRPRDATRNLPSDTGAQTTQPSGAVTGAGQPQGTLPQPRAGKPGGLEERARGDADSKPGSDAGDGGAIRQEPPDTQHLTGSFLVGI